MERKIEQVIFSRPVISLLKNVAAYARVSSGKDAMLHSLSAQVSYYSEMIQKEPGWKFCGVYADEALTGTRDNREEFQRLLEACRAGQVDMIITKSISRFSRNTITLLETVRELKQLGVDIYFEEQNIHTMSADGELLLTILASYAQEESRSVSENMKWRVRKNFEEGIPWSSYMLGYRLRDGQFQIVPEEAELVRRIFHEYLAGDGYEKIANRLNEEGFISPRGTKWGSTGIGRTIKNYTYTGNLVLQRTFSSNHLTKKMVKNEGQLPKFLVEDAHDPIIDMETFQAAQRERERRANRFVRKVKKKPVYPFTGLLKCEVCGKNYRRKITATGPVWICSTFNMRGKKACASKQIPEDVLMESTAVVLGTKKITTALTNGKLQEITVLNGNRLVYRLLDGQTIIRKWSDRSRCLSWTPEKRAAASQKTKDWWYQHG